MAKPQANHFKTTDPADVAKEEASALVRAAVPDFIPMSDSMTESVADAMLGIKRLRSRSQLFAIILTVFVAVLVAIVMLKLQPDLSPDTPLLVDGSTSASAQTSAQAGAQMNAEAGVQASAEETAAAAVPVGAVGVAGALSKALSSATAAAAQPTGDGSNSFAAGGGAWQQVGGDRYFVYPDGTNATGVININGAVISFDESGRWLSTRLDVPYVSQLPDMPYGCELVSVTMMLNYAGVALSKEELAATLSYSGDPNQGFTGSLYGAADGLGGIVYPQGIIGVAQAHLPSAADLTGASWQDIGAYLDQGKPVCIWITTSELDHTVLLTGYSPDTVWINDPQLEKDMAMGSAEFFNYWRANGFRALSY